MLNLISRRIRISIVSESGKRIPFVIENYAYRDEWGRETDDVVSPL